jgi:hypothetical protein
MKGDFTAFQKTKLLRFFFFNPQSAIGVPLRPLKGNIAGALPPPVFHPESSHRRVFFVHILFKIDFLESMGFKFPQLLPN